MHFLSSVFYLRLSFFVLRFATEYPKLPSFLPREKYSPWEYAISPA